MDKKKSFEETMNRLATIKNNKINERSRLPKALYRSKLYLGNTELECAVLDNENNTRIITATAITKAFGKTDSGMNIKNKMQIEKDFKTLYPNINLTRIPIFLSSRRLLPLFSDKLLNLTRTISYIDGGKEYVGYEAAILPEICELYLKARRENKLLPRQRNIAKQAEILLSSLAKVGIIALIDEATGFQQNRKSDALRLLLQAYLAEGIKKWIKEFPDDFFLELDRLYGNIAIKANKRPMYYGSFINKYVYEPIESGKINEELQKRYITDNKKHRKHQSLTDFGSGQLRLQIGKILGLMQIAPNMRWFKEKQSRQGMLALFPDEI